jgi:hypothetical protein
MRTQFPDDISPLQVRWQRATTATCLRSTAATRCRFPSPVRSAGTICRFCRRSTSGCSDSRHARTGPAALPDGRPVRALYPQFDAFQRVRRMLDREAIFSTTIFVLSSPIARLACPAREDHYPERRQPTLAVDPWRAVGRRNTGACAEGGAGSGEPAEVGAAAGAPMASAFESRPVAWKAPSLHRGEVAQCRSASCLAGQIFRACRYALGLPRFDGQGDPAKRVRPSIARRLSPAAPHMAP